MKTRRMVLIGAGILLAARIFSEHTLQAQTQFSSAEAQPDSLVRLVAEGRKLPVVPLEELPRFGTYWEAFSLYGKILPPMPFAPENTNAVVYQMAEGQFLVANGQECVIPQPLRRTGFLPMTPMAFAESQLEQVENLIVEIQNAEINAELDAMLGLEGEMSLMEEEGGEEFGLLDGESYGTNLWIEVLTNALAIEGQFGVVLQNTIPGEFYDVLTKASLTDPVWTVDVPGVEAQSNSIPVPILAKAAGWCPAPERKLSAL